MGNGLSECRTCHTPLPVGAAYCPTCGAATPTEISQGTGEQRRPRTGSLDDVELRARLQRIVGEDYRVDDVIGRGGFGIVFAARDLTLDRDVAIKALRPELVTFPALVERFKREARAAARLRHPNIIPIYLVGGTESVAYIVMPRIQGESLKVVLQSGARLSIEEAQRILTEAGRALAVAHQAGIIHRDVKPENILLEGPQRHVYLTDFGIAKAIGSEDEGLTATGMVVGTPSYMSPEQAGGQPHLDHRADIYSLGVVGFQMLTGQLPFVADGLNDLIFQQITKEAPAVETLRPDVPEFLAAAIERCLRRDPTERWETAEELARAVTDETYVGSRPRRPIRPGRRVALALTGVGIAALATFLAVRGYESGATSAVVEDSAAAPSATTMAVEDTAALAASQSDTATVVARDAAGPQEPSSPGPSTAVVPPPTVPATTQTPQAASAPARAPPVEQPAMGFLTINAEPWGMVQIDGVNIKETPLASHSVPPGIHVIRVLKDGYVPIVDTVTVTAGNALRRTYALERQR